MQNKVLFLDIDGVLNSEDWFSMTRGHNKAISPEYTDEILKDRGQIDPVAVSRINKIIEQTDCKIIISSVRRFSYDKTVFQLEQKGLIPNSIIGRTPHIEFVNKDYSVPRGCEINDYVKNNDVDVYCILDDDIDFLISQSDYFIKIDPFHGITNRDVEKAIQILNQKL